MTDSTTLKMTKTYKFGQRVYWRTPLGTLWGGHVKDGPFDGRWLVHPDTTVFDLWLSGPFYTLPEL